MRIMEWDISSYEDYKNFNTNILDTKGILKSITEINPEILILSSYHLSYNSILKNGLEKYGYNCKINTDNPEKTERNRVLIASKYEIINVEFNDNLGFYTKDWLEVKVKIKGEECKILAVHVPASSTNTLYKQRINTSGDRKLFLKEMLGKFAAYEQESVPCIVAGNFNLHDFTTNSEYRSKFAQHMTEISAGKPTYKGQAYDYLFANEIFLKINHIFNTSAHENNYTDHSYLLVDINNKGEYKMKISENELTSDTFKQLVIFSIAEPGAMSFPNSMEIVDDKGKYFVISFDEIPFASVKKFFPALADCIFNGPMPGEAVADGEIVIYPPSSDEKNSRTTHVADGWHHVYMGAGNHLVIKEEIFPLFAKYIHNKSPSEIYSTWSDHIEKFVKEISGKE